MRVSQKKMKKSLCVALNFPLRLCDNEWRFDPHFER